jgi:hypothetical protein
VFWPPSDPPPRIMAEYGTICQDGVFERRLEPAAAAEVTS